MALEECGLDDLGFLGDIFTWRNHSHMQRVISEKDWTEQWATWNGERNFQHMRL
jgi:hypothetical protein